MDISVFINAPDLLEIISRNILKIVNTSIKGYIIVYIL